jgi:peroxiredoxin
MNIIKSYKPISIVIIAFALIVATACGGGSTNVTIIGTIDGAQNKFVLLRETGHDKISTIDSTRTNKKGEFEFSLHIDSPSFLLLQLEGELEPIVLLVQPKDRAVVKSRVGSFASSYSVIGSEGSILVRELNAKLNGVVSKIDSLSSQFMSNREHPKFDSIKHTIDNTYNLAILNHRQYTERFIRENRYSLASILALYQQYDKSRSVLNKREDFDLFRLVDETLFPLYPNNLVVVNFHNNVKMIGKQLELYDKRKDMLDVGEKIPNISFKSFQNEEIELQDIKGKYFLIDFWATWCNECASNNAKLLKLYSEFESKGFQVIQVSLDSKPSDILNVVEKDSIPWIVIADYLQWDSPILDTLSINSIPSNYLIDRNGVIRARNLEPRELEDLLKQLLP